MLDATPLSDDEAVRFLSDVDARRYLQGRRERELGRPRDLRDFSAVIALDWRLKARSKGTR
jgi:hypothetical protein